MLDGAIRSRRRQRGAVSPDSDEELGSLNGDSTHLTGFLLYRIDGEDYSSLITCVSLDDESILGVEFSSSGIEITIDEASAQISDLLDTLAFSRPTSNGQPPGAGAPPRRPLVVVVGPPRYARRMTRSERRSDPS